MEHSTEPLDSSRILADSNVSVTSGYQTESTDDNKGWELRMMDSGRVPYMAA